MKTLFKGALTVGLTASFLLSNGVIAVFAQYDDGYGGSYNYDTGYGGSYNYDTGYGGSYNYDTGYGGSYNYDTGYGGSYNYDTGYGGSYNYDTGYGGSYTGSYDYGTGYTGSYDYPTTYTGSYDYGYTSPTYDYYYTTPTSYYTPVYTTPVYTTPVYTTPVYTTPTYTTPTYVNPPVYTTPVYTPPTVQACTSDAKVCPDGTVVGRTGPNCQFICPTTTPPQTHTCPNGQVLPITSPCPPQTKTCADGTVVNIGDTCYKNCPDGSRIPEGQVCPTIGTHVCPDGSVIPINQSCPTRICSDGTQPIGGICYRTCPNGSRIPETNTCPNLTQTCWDGSVIPVYSQCPSQYKTCPNGSYVPIYQSCTRVCSNGIIVNDGAICYRTCPNGATVPEGQTCPFVMGIPTVNLNVDRATVPFGGTVLLSWTSQNTNSCFASNGWNGPRSITGSEPRSNITSPTTFIITCQNAQGQSATDSVTVYPIGQEIKVNSVITSIPTEITSTSARCNGIGLIANGAPSNAWFEYGETGALGKTTATAYIGTAHTAPFSNKLSGLRPSTKYYCRAVMSNSNGTFKGDIVSFTTKSNKVSYVKKVVTKKVENKTVKQIVCTDGTTVVLKDSSTGKMLAEGAKLISLQIEKVNGNITPGSEVTYRLTYKNAGSVELKDVTFKIVIPQEYALLAASTGAFDRETQTISVPVLTLAPGAQGEVNWQVKVNGNANVGKTLITTAYGSYTVPDTEGTQKVQDEATTYIVGTVASANGDNGGTTTTNPLQKSKATFLPNTLIEWFALFAIILILMILGRSVYLSWKGNDEVRKS